MSEHSALAIALHDLANAVRGAAQNHSRPVTKNDLVELEDSLTMKLDLIKQAVTAAAKQNREAFTEIGTKIADLNRQIQDLKDAATNPDVTDETFLADLAALQADAQKLADIVPGSPSPDQPPSDGTGTTPTAPGQVERRAS